MAEAVKAVSPAVVISGMHRSGTSLTATLLAAAGVRLGDEPLTASAGDPGSHGHHLEFHGLHQRMLAANGLSLEGYTCQQEMAVPAPLRAEALEVVKRRRATGRPWGWQDPRTVLFLDFWAELVPEARWLFIVRPPEDVIDSLFRRGDTAFAFNPRHAADLWVGYNRRILAFARRHPTRTLVVDLGRVIADPNGVVTAVADLLGTALAAPGQHGEPGLPRSGQPARRAGLVRAVAPQARDLHDQLLQLAGDAAGGDSDRDPTMTAIAEAGLAEWREGCSVRAERTDLTARAAEAIEMAERLERELAAERVARAEATSRGGSLAADLAWLQAENAEESRCRAASEARCAELEQDRAVLGAAHDALAARCASLTAEVAAVRTAQAEAKTAHERELAVALQRLAAAEASCDNLKQLLTNRDMVIGRLEAAVAEAQSLADRSQQEIEVLAGEQDDLVAQLEAERAIHESLRQDMAGRIEAAVAGRR